MLDVFRVSNEARRGTPRSRGAGEPSPPCHQVPPQSQTGGGGGRPRLPAARTSPGLFSLGRRRGPVPCGSVTVSALSSLSGRNAGQVTSSTESRRCPVAACFHPPQAKYFYITPGICPSLSTMRAIVECAGGKVLPKQPSFRKLMEHKQNKVGAGAGGGRRLRRGASRAAADDPVPSLRAWRKSSSFPARTTCTCAGSTSPAGSVGRAPRVRGGGWCPGAAPHSPFPRRRAQRRVRPDRGAHADAGLRVISFARWGVAGARREAPSPAGVTLRPPGLVRPRAFALVDAVRREGSRTVTVTAAASVGWGPRVPQAARPVPRPSGCRPVGPGWVSPGGGSPGGSGSPRAGCRRGATVARRP